ncbi:hypothetical protein Vqi01_12030 [Micromonospora qiuiae]|uniref:Uncharacterized protein n=1 Tax=Micromonospora qiuiae TaxID=502268 RepID=A0ABQ4J783_9ACTN|nr:hypothetical protein Vqi01_12030 [Micromonospora qiuiae]
MFPIRTNPAGATPATKELITMLHLPNVVAEMYLLNEALSRARMLRPQAGRTTSTEATRSARTVAMAGRARSARELGVL